MRDHIYRINSIYSFLEKWITSNITKQAIAVPTEFDSTSKTSPFRVRVKSA